MTASTSIDDSTGSSTSIGDGTGSSTSIGDGTGASAAWTRCGTAGSGLERVAGSTGMLRSDCSYSCVTHLNTFSASASVGLIVNGCRISQNRFVLLQFGSSRSASANIQTPVLTLQNTVNSLSLSSCGLQSHSIREMYFWASRNALLAIDRCNMYRISVRYRKSLSVRSAIVTRQESWMRTTNSMRSRIACKSPSSCLISCCSRNCAAIKRCIGVSVTSCIVFERFGCGWRFAMAFGADTLSSSEPEMAKTRVTIGSYGVTRCSGAENCEFTSPVLVFIPSVPFCSGPPNVPQVVVQV